MHLSQSHGSTKPATVAGPQMSATVLEDEFSTTPEEFAAIDERVKLQYRRKLTMRAAQTSTANTSSDLSDYNEDIFSSTTPEEFAAIDERVKLQYRRKLTMRAAAVSVKSDDNKPTSASLVVDKPCFFNKLMRFFSKGGNQDCRESDQDRSNYSLCWCSPFGNGLASLERLDKIECWLAQGDRGSGVVTGRGAEIGPSIRSVPQRAGANSGRAAAQEGVYARNAWRLNGGVDGCHGVELNP
ncbi:hypothetical protein THAOC_20783 [Thalassiosira oceanica]|uniref:Uncharacterized protein n=1 Tax=Thalassiosira oceanica TaxID=159749 RepID=K0RZ09_THAOC|nr:hypothetical protein THAOC_20783 [Thalassiosira oceanica]|eukprot:EJK59048.1 hypothetical protein THAOC_20783 [Thalassiosira oceanica]